MRHYSTKKSGLTIIEILISLAIVSILVSIVITSYSRLTRTQAVEKDAYLVVSIFDQARNQTISSMGATQYGVHVASTSVTLFSGSSYSAGASGNKTTSLNARDQVLSLSLTGGGSDIIFARLSGQTANDGTFQISSTGASTTKTVTIYKTGLVETN